MIYEGNFENGSRKGSFPFPKRHCKLWKNTNFTKVKASLNLELE